MPRRYGGRMSTGLEGVVAATTRLSHVDGLRGELLIAGFPVEELAEHATFEEATWLLWYGLLFMAMVLWKPDGIAGLWQDWRRRRLAHGGLIAAAPAGTSV